MRKTIVTIVNAESVPNDLGTSQSRYDLKLRLGDSNHTLNFIYLDQGNNAEYESSLEIQHIYNLTPFYEFALECFHEFLDSEYDLIKSGVAVEIDLDKGTSTCLEMRWLAFCPIYQDLENALNIAKNSLESGMVCLVSGENVSQVNFTGPRANAYGYDLHLYQIDTDGNYSLVSVGDFR